jgi:hypothetical protein
MQHKHRRFGEGFRAVLGDEHSQAAQMTLAREAVPNLDPHLSSLRDPVCEQTGPPATAGMMAMRVSLLGRDGAVCYPHFTSKRPSFVDACCPERGSRKGRSRAQELAPLDVLGIVDERRWRQAAASRLAAISRDHVAGGYRGFNADPTFACGFDMYAVADPRRARYIAAGGVIPPPRDNIASRDRFTVAGPGARGRNRRCGARGYRVGADDCRPMPDPPATAAGLGTRDTEAEHERRHDGRE